MNIRKHGHQAYACAKENARCAETGHRHTEFSAEIPTEMRTVYVCLWWLILYEPHSKHCGHWLFLSLRSIFRRIHSLSHNMKTYMYLDQLLFFQKHQTDQVQQLGRPTEVAEEATGKSGKTCAASRIDFAGFLLGIVYTDWP